MECLEKAAVCAVRELFTLSQTWRTLNSFFGHRSSDFVKPDLENFGSEVVGRCNQGQGRIFILGRGAAPSVGTQVVFKTLSIMSSWDVDIGFW